MARDWTRGTLRDLVSLRRGHDLPEQQREPGEVPVMGAAGKNGFHSTAIASGPGIVVGRSGASYGKVHYCPEDYWPHNTALYVTDFHGNDPRFVYYFLRAIDFSRYNSGSAQPSLNRNHIYPMPIAYPGLAEQRAIAEVLASIDDKTAGNRRTIRTLNSVAKAIFKGWFVNFEPVKAKADGADAFPGMPQEVFETLPRGLGQTDVGLTPEGWPLGTLGTILSELSERNRDEAIDLVLSAVSTGELVASDDHFSKRVYSKSLANYKIVPPGCIAFNPSRINIGSIGINHRRDAGVVSPVYVVCQVPPIYEWFLQFFLRLPHCLQQFQVLSSGSVRQSLRAIDFLSIPLVIPPDNVLCSFNDTFSVLKEMIDLREKEIGVLESLESALLPKLITGEIRVGENGEVNHGG